MTDQYILDACGRRRVPFRQPNLTRVLVGINKAGAKPGRVEVEPDGKITVFFEREAIRDRARSVRFVLMGNFGRNERLFTLAVDKLRVAFSSHSGIVKSLIL